MAVMLTVGELALDMRLATDPAIVPAEYVDILTRALATAKDHVEEYAGPSTPQAALDLAAAKMASFLVDSPTYARMPILAFRNSGCESLLSMWHEPRGLVI